MQWCPRVTFTRSVCQALGPAGCSLRMSPHGSFLNCRSPLCGHEKSAWVALWNRLAHADPELELGELPAAPLSLLSHCHSAVIIVTLSCLCLLQSPEGPAHSALDSSVPQQSLHTASRYPSTLSPWMTFSWAKNRPDPASVTIKGAQGLAGCLLALSRMQVTQGKQLLSGRTGQRPAQEGPWKDMGPSGPTSCTQDERLRLRAAQRGGWRGTRTGRLCRRPAGTEPTPARLG